MARVDGYYEFGTLDEIECERCGEPLDWLMDGEDCADCHCCDRIYRAYVPEDDPTAWRVFSDKDGE
jgi:hypothetical protein